MCGSRVSKAGDRNRAARSATTRAGTAVGFATDQGEAAVVSSIERRLIAAERKPLKSQPTLRQFFVYGGLVENAISRQASIAGGETIQAEPGEDFEGFRQWIVARAISEGAAYAT